MQPVQIYKGYTRRDLIIIHKLQIITIHINNNKP